MTNRPVIFIGEEENADMTTNKSCEQSRSPCYRPEKVLTCYQCGKNITVIDLCELPTQGWAVEQNFGRTVYACPEHKQAKET